MSNATALTSSYAWSFTLYFFAWSFHAYGLKLNASKIEIFVPDIRQNIRNLPPVSDSACGSMGRPCGRAPPPVKNLGVIFYSHLSWDVQVKDVAPKCMGLLLGLRHLRLIPLAESDGDHCAMCRVWSSHA